MKKPTLEEWKIKRKNARRPRTFRNRGPARFFLVWDWDFRPQTDYPYPPYDDIAAGSLCMAMYRYGHRLASMISPFELSLAREEYRALLARKVIWMRRELRYLAKTEPILPR